MCFTPLVCCECERERRGNILGEAIGELQLSPRDLRRHRSRLMTWVRKQYAVWGPQKTVFVRKDSWCKSADNTGESEGDNEERSVVLCRESGRWINSQPCWYHKGDFAFFPECTAALLHCAVEKMKLLPNFKKHEMILLTHVKRGQWKSYVKLHHFTSFESEISL